MSTLPAQQPRISVPTLIAAAGDRAEIRFLEFFAANIRNTHMAGFAEFAREIILERTAEGRAHAKSRGVNLGRKPKLTEHQRREAKARRDAGEETKAEIGGSYNVSGWTISRL